MKTTADSPCPDHGGRGAPRRLLLEEEDRDLLILILRQFIKESGMYEPDAARILANLEGARDGR